MTPLWTEQTLERACGAPVRVRIYKGAPENKLAPLVLHLHGGAFTDGSVANGQAVASLLADAGANVVSVDYPTAPAIRFPGALEASLDALRWTYRTCPAIKQARLFLAGEEAGGNLAAALALMARDQHSPPVAGQILLSPMLDPCLGTHSVREAEAGPVGCKWADGWHDYLGSADKASHPYAAPLGASRLMGLPPALVITAEDDPLRDESLSYAKRLTECGVYVRQEVLPAPTGWPDALQAADADPAWSGRLRDCFSEFFQTADELQKAVGPHPSVP
ncbi:MAG TPA: alpha/beta hydrolase [Alphaproteobacteria bacterium]|nr:alpha/beta hydrolase [Alphaproteobacteria bacterium]